MAKTVATGTLAAMVAASISGLTGCKREERIPGPAPTATVGREFLVYSK
ncbi:MAG: hypothetical protein L6Q84_09225 [Polyangiaceae bacterium]|nr:hypothetical protein [Polyangiaceae bacterium]